MHCVVQGCETEVTREGHSLCYSHWKLQRAGKVKQCSNCGTWGERSDDLCPSCNDDVPVMIVPDQQQDTRGMLSSTKLAEHFSLTSRRTNLVLAELGWIKKFVKGWISTEIGANLGAMQKEMRDKGIPYVVWPAEIVENTALLDAIREVRGDAAEDGGKTKKLSTQQFREKYPAKYRTTDGHMVRSRGEVLIDNWLYMQGLVHAYERRLPIEEEVISDFYLPMGNVFIEYWGLEDNDVYAARAEEKRKIYASGGFRLVEISDEEIAQLDDVLPRKLLKYGINCT